MWVEASCGVMFTDLPLAYIFSHCLSPRLLWRLISYADVLRVCVIDRRTTTMSTQSVTALDLGGEWPSHRAPGPALAYQSQYAAQSAVSICVMCES